LAYADVGEGLPVVLLHAFPLNGRAFGRQVDALARDFRLIIPDLPGFGESDPLDGAPSLTAFAGEVLALLDHLELPSAVVGGVSMGGYTSLALLRADPSRVQALLLLDTQATADDAAGKARREEMAQAVLREGMDYLVWVQAPNLLSPRAPQAVREELHGLMRSNAPEGAAWALRAMAERQDSLELLHRFAGPALVVVGSEDVVTPKAKAAQMASGLAHARLVELAGAGHLANLEAPDAFNQALAQFLKSTEQAGEP
jgi:pimeloyl-ACP methyl ester carboxylesterase